jgi:hypothetical protein
MTIKETMMSDEKGLVPVEEAREVSVFEPNTAFGVPMQVLKDSIEDNIAQYDLARIAIGKLLKENENDFYYQSEQNGGKRKPNEPIVVAKPGVDKLANFFKLRIVPTEEEIDGGFKVTAVGSDMHGNYIGTGFGRCTVYEPKYMWTAASDAEFVAADDINKRMKKTKWGPKKQVRTDARAIAHTLSSMATKRARAAFLRSAVPGLSGFNFEGEEHQVEYEDAPPAEPMATDKEKKALLTLAKKAGLDAIGLKGIVKDETVTGESKTMTSKEHKHIESMLNIMIKEQADE